MIKLREIDKQLIFATMALAAIGLVMIYSTSAVMAMKRYGNEYFFVRRQLMFIVLGFLLFFIFAKIPYYSYQKWTYPILFSSLILLIMLFIPGIGSTAGGARRWIKVGTFTFQPSEFAKLAVIIYLSYYLSAKREKIKRFSIGVLPPVIMSGLFIVFLLKEPDFGTSMSLGAMVIIMMFIAGVRLSHLISIFLIAIPFIYLIATRFPHVLRRILVFLNPWKDPGGAGYHIIQSFLAFGTGGISGVGLGDGRRKLFYLPEAHTDFILSVVGEELGLIGVSILILFYLVILVCGIRISLKTTDPFGQYLAMGVTLLVVLQAAVNMAVATALLPTKGLTLPFISYGGTSLVINLIAMGILLNIYRTGVRE